MSSIPSTRIGMGRRNDLWILLYGYKKWLSLMILSFCNQSFVSSFCNITNQINNFALKGTTPNQTPFVQFITNEIKEDKATCKTNDLIENLLLKSKSQIAASSSVLLLANLKIRLLRYWSCCGSHFLRYQS